MKITLYRIFPDQIKRLIRRGYSILPITIRMGKTYNGTREFIRSSERWTGDEIKSWQLARLKKIISHAFETVPGYRQLYNENGVSPNDINTLNDIRRLPFVSKELLRDNIEDFTSTAVPGWKRLYRTTGGSTGIPFGFYLLQEDIERELAFLHSAWSRAGWKLGDVSAVLRGAFIGSETDISEYDPFLKDLRLSTYYLNEKTYRSYRQKLLSVRPSHLQAYPSAAALFADLIIQNDDQGKVPFRLLLLGSENLYGWQKEKILRAFPGARIFAWYGHAEQVLFAPMCEESGEFHIDPFYGLAEILDRDGNEVSEGETGELVGTSMWNMVTPFIRYRTMDLAGKGAANCPRCGRRYQLLDSIQGRLQELIVTKTGRYISMTAINMHSDIFDNVRQFQFRQSEAGRVTFNIVRNSGYSEKDTKKIHSELMKKLGGDMDLDIKFVDSIEVPKSGKFRFLIQELALSYGDHERP